MSGIAKFYKNYKDKIDHNIKSRRIVCSNITCNECIFVAGYEGCPNDLEDMIIKHKEQIKILKEIETL